MLIPNIIPIMSDETLYSYAERLAQANSLTLRQFANAFIFPERNLTKSEGVSADCIFDLHFFLNNLGITPDSYIEMVKSHTILPFILPNQTIACQIETVLSLFDYNQKAKTAFNDIRFVGRKISVCPLCKAEEERQYGYFWLHCEHQLPGVKVCKQHHIPLVRYNGKRAIDRVSLTDECIDKFIPETEIVTEGEIAYSFIASQFLKAEIGGNVELINTRIKNYIYNRFYANGKAVDNFSAVIRSFGNDSLLTTTNLNNKSIGRILNGAFIKSGRIALILLLFDRDMDKAKDFIGQDVSQKAAFLSNLTGYSLLSDYSDHFVLLKHTKCGKTFVTHPGAFGADIKCPYCNKDSPGELLYKLCAFAANGNYEFPNHDLVFGEKMIIKNVIQGITEFKTPASFLSEIHYVSPKRIHTTEYAASRKLNNEFTLVKFTRYDGPATVKHNTCDNIFEVNNFKSFVRYNRCPYCDPNSTIRSLKTREAKFVNRLSKTYEDEYTLIGPYTNSHTPTKFIHNPPKGCGTVFEMEPNDINHPPKSLCPHCRKKISANRLTDEDINKILRALSSGKYSMIRRGRRNKIWIQNNETGKAKRMSYKKAIQYLKEHNYSDLP